MGIDQELKWPCVVSLSHTHTLNKLNHVICKPTWGREVLAFRTAEYPLNEFLIFLYSRSWTLLVIRNDVMDTHWIIYFFHCCLHLLFHSLLPQESGECFLQPGSWFLSWSYKIHDIWAYKIHDSEMQRKWHAHRCTVSM